MSCLWPKMEEEEKSEKLMIFWGMALLEFFLGEHSFIGENTSLKAICGAGSSLWHF